MKRIIGITMTAVLLIAAMLTLTACDGANSSAWSIVSGRSEKTFDGGFSIGVNSASSGTRNRTYTLTAEELAAIQVTSSSDEGTIILVVSQDGAADGTKIETDISNFDGGIATDSLNPGCIRFSLRFEDVKNSNTSINWR